VLQQCELLQLGRLPEPVLAAQVMGAAYDHHLMAHQVMADQPRPLSVTEPNCRIDIGCSGFIQLRIPDQGQAHIVVRFAELWQPRNQPADPDSRGASHIERSTLSPVGQHFNGGGLELLVNGKIKRHIFMSTGTGSPGAPWSFGGVLAWPVAR